jgi:hypothetical protein
MKHKTSAPALVTYHTVRHSSLRLLAAAAVFLLVCVGCVPFRSVDGVLGGFEHMRIMQIPFISLYTTSTSPTRMPY